MTVRGLGNPDRGTIEPFLHLAPGGGEGLGALEYPRVGDQPHVRQQARPGEPHGCRAIQPLIQPGARGFVLGKRGDASIEEQIRVDQNHRYASPSAAASTSATSSMLPSRQRPSEVEGVRYGGRRAGGATICSSPCRRASLTASLRLTFRAS